MLASYSDRFEHQSRRVWNLFWVVFAPTSLYSLLPVRLCTVYCPYALVPYAHVPFSAREDDECDVMMVINRSLFCVRPVFGRHFASRYILGYA